MGMSIDESVKGLHDIQDYYNDDRLGFDKNDNESIDLAVETLRKYQKIEQILKDIPYGGEATVRRIQEVLEDGTN